MTDKVYNKQALNNFSSGMMDIQLPRNPLASEVVLVFNDVVRDQYQDAIGSESHRVKKFALVRKNPDLHYVQQFEEELMEDDLEKLPWYITLTMTDLPRRPRLDDQILIEGLLYKISYVSPLNRYLDNIVNIAVHPDRNDVDALAIYSVTELDDGYYDILYGGSPVSYSFSEESLVDPSVRLPWTSRPAIPEESVSKLYIFDKDNTSATINISANGS